MVVISHLHNPSGASLAPGEADALESLASRRALRILVDETYRDSAKHPLGTFASRGPTWVATSSLTKSYGLGGLRIGWVAGSEDVLARCAAAQNALTVQPALPSVALALALIPHLDSLRERTHRILARNHAAWHALVVRRAAAGRGGADIDFGPSPAGTTAWCRAPGKVGGEVFSEFAARAHGLAVTPGRFFGDPFGFRVALGFEPESFGAALLVLEQAISDFVAAGTTAPASR
jgi:aspartate/methionine/tyrosine aminotransferase